MLEELRFFGRKGRGEAQSPQRFHAKLQNKTRCAVLRTYWGLILSLELVSELSVISAPA